MQSNDIHAFSASLAHLTKYFPESKIDLESTLEGYFEDLAEFPLAIVQAACVEARRTCRFFPKPVELRELAAHLTTPQGFACKVCHGDHGDHAGHVISHYPAGPWCSTCQADLPTPATYQHTMPYQQPFAPLPALPPADVRETMRLMMHDLAEHGSGKRSARDARWARGHVAMFEAGVAAPGRAAQAIAWCERMAEEDVENAADWLEEARGYRLDLEVEE